MGNDVDRNDANAVALELEIAEAHRRINTSLVAAMDT